MCPSVRSQWSPKPSEVALGVRRAHGDGVLLRGRGLALSRPNVQPHSNLENTPAQRRLRALFKTPDPYSASVNVTEGRKEPRAADDRIRRGTLTRRRPPADNGCHPVPRDLTHHPSPRGAAGLRAGGYSGRVPTLPVILLEMLKSREVLCRCPNGPR